MIIQYKTELFNNSFILFAATKQCNNLSRDPAKPTLCHVRNSEDLDHPTHSRSLIRIIAFTMNKTVYKKSTERKPKTQISLRGRAG